jgi:hypothetical protein
MDVLLPVPDFDTNIAPRAQFASELIAMPLTNLHCTVRGGHPIVRAMKSAWPGRRRSSPGQLALINRALVNSHDSQSRVG